MYSIFFLILACLLSAIQIFFQHTPITTTILQWLLFCNIGLQGCLGFIGHFFMSDEIAKKIGWPEGNPFQIEIAFTNLAFGVIGLLCFFFKGNFWLATIVGRTVFLWGAAYVHIRDIKENRNFHPYNAGPVLWMAILLPIIWITIGSLLISGY